MKYDTWKTKDGRAIFVELMSDEHLLNTARAIEEERVFPGGGLEADNWLMVLRGEALKRGLDPEGVGTKTLGLLEFAVQNSGGWPWHSMSEEEVLVRLRKGLATTGVKEPMLDVSNFTDRPTYLHWEEGGTPL